jgi:hypothetical protein
VLIVLPVSRGGQHLSNTCDPTGRNETHRPLVRQYAALILFVAGSLSDLIASEEPKKPDPNDAALIARGKMVYAEHCVSCHGEKCPEGDICLCSTFAPSAQFKADR